MYEQYLADRRLAMRAEALQQAMVQRQQGKVSALARNWTEQMAAYRFLNNERVQVPQLIDGLCARAVAALAAGPGHLLAIQDTTQLNFQPPKGSRRAAAAGLGVIGDGQSAGFFLHPTLLVEAERGQALGFADVVLWNREAEAAGSAEGDYQALPLEQKESRRWVQSPERARARLGEGVHLTLLADRESDLWELFARLPDERTDVLVRAAQDRRIAESPQGLFAYLAAQPLGGQAALEVRGDVRRGRQARTAPLEYRWARVTLVRPRKGPQVGPREVPLWALEVRECPESVPAGEEPIHWRLLTTHVVERFEQARQVVAWYRQRWHIEQVFRLLKTEGLDVESSALERGSALQRLAVLALGAALDVLRLLLAERGENEQPLEQVFDALQRECLQRVGPTLEGKTTKQQNPHPPQTLAWAAWIVARLGGWKGYRSQRPAGPLTYRRGLTAFALLCQGLALARPDVYNP